LFVFGGDAAGVCLEVELPDFCAGEEVEGVFVEVLSVDVDDAVREAVVAGCADGGAGTDVGVVADLGLEAPDLRAGAGVEGVDGVVGLAAAHDDEGPSGRVGGECGWGP